MKCQDLETLLSGHVLGELTPTQQQAAAAHIEGCEACRSKWGLDEQSQVLHEAAKPLVDDKDVKDAVMAEIRERKRQAAGVPAEPKRLGGFELLGRLGKGGMGTVLKARQVSMDRVVALKILPQRLAQNEQFVQRFLREARSAGKLRHPHIVQAFEVGQVEGYYFFAMEFVDGETLSDVIRRDGPLEPNRALGIMKQVCSALAAAHEAGLVHRDIKPANIMIDKKGEVRVTDFGLAKRTEGDVAVTADGHALGTPAYVSPEMAKGGEAESRSDLYSLGATIFCALAGRPPFEGKNFSEVLIKQVNEPAPPLASLTPRVDRRLCHIIDRLLRKNPDARFPSAVALLDDLNGLGKLQPVATAARAEGRAMIAEAPTLEMTEGKRREHQARLDAHRPKSNRTTLVTVGAIVAILAIVGVVVATRGPKETAAKPATEKTKVVKPPDETEKGAAVADVEAAKRNAEVAEKERIAKSKEEALAKARQQGGELLKQADAAIATKDYAKARSAIKSAEALAVPDLADEAEKKLEEIASREKSAEAWATWDGVKSQAKKLADAGQFDDALKLLDGATTIPLDKIADQIAEQTQSIEDARRALAEKAVAAYAAESDKVWALFKDRKYSDADKFLATLAARPDAKLVAEPLKADAEAAKLLKEFWAAVEQGLAAKAGQFVSFRGAAGGTLVTVQDGTATVKTPKGEEPRRVQDLVAKQALLSAQLKPDERGMLMEAVFLLAEGEKLDDAEKLLAAAGTPPAVPVYKGRLDRLLGRAKALAQAKEAEARETAAGDAWRQIEAAAKGDLTQEKARRLLPAVEQFAQKHAATKFYEGVSAEAKALDARIKEAAYAQVKHVDLLAEYAGGRWKDVVFRGKWVRESGGYRIDPVGGMGPDFGWTYPLPEGTVSLRLFMKFTMAPAGEVLVTVGETPGVNTGKGVRLCYNLDWGAGLSAGRLERKLADAKTAPLFDISSGWHSLVMEVDPRSIAAALDEKSKVHGQGQSDPKFITLSGDEFAGWRIQSLRAELTVRQTRPETTPKGEAKVPDTHK